MKNLKYLLFMSFISLAVFSGCEDEPSASNISRVTFFPSFEFEGGTSAFVACNSSFELPPVRATENGQELATTTTVQGLFSGADVFDIAVADKYVITTSAVNADGFPAELVRSVWVVCTGDLVNSIEGLYTATVVRNGAGGPQYTDMEYVMIRSLGGNQYELSDAIGGYYDIGRAYGDAYRASGIVITANDISSDNFSFNGPVGVGAFGGSLVMKSMSVDPATRTITFESEWAADASTTYTFVVTLNQVQI